MARIHAIQERRRHRLEARTERVLDNLDESPPAAGRVIARHGANLGVEDDAGGVWHCLARQHIGEPVCGDRVVWQPAGPGQGIVTALLERQNLLSRPDQSGRDRPLAANIDQVVIVLAPLPEPSLYLLDQYLVAAELIGARALIVINKIDLLVPQTTQAFRARLARYGLIGYTILCLSLRQPWTLPPFVDQLRGRTSILVGQSGVGKSSLIKRLLPDIAIQIGRLSRATGLGRHTTSATTCYRIGGDSRLIDSPGVRSFRLGPVTPSDLARGYREIAPFIGHCRFNDCQHDQEPDCALKEAVAAGGIHPERLATFRHLLQSQRSACERL